MNSSPLTRDTPRAVDLQFNYPVLASQPSEVSALLRSLSEDTGALLGHQPYGGREKHREIAAQWLSRDGDAISAERTLLCPGGHNAVMVTLLACGLRGRRIAVDPLTYTGFKLQAATLGIELVPCEGDVSGMLPDALTRAAADKHVTAVFLMPTVHNPMGNVMPLVRRLELCEVARAHDLILIDDDAYCFCEAAPPASFAVLAPERAFSVWSFTKPVAPALKVAYLAIPDKFCDAAITAIRVTSSGASALVSELATRMVQDESLSALLQSKRNEAAQRQKIARESLDGVAWSGHPTSFHVWVALPTDKKAAAITDQLRRQGVLVNGSDDFAAVPGIRANGMRLALGATDELAALRGALEQVRLCVLS